MTTVAFLDTSALVKLVSQERETAALRAWLAGPAGPDVVTTSTLGAVELLRAARRLEPDAAPEAERVLASVAQVSLTPSIMRAAAGLDPPPLRSLHALHLATALAIGSSLTELVAYDLRLLEAAVAIGLSTLSPS